MILADTRYRLTRDDAQLAARLLASESGQDLATLETMLADEGIDAILDDPRLSAALRRDPRGAHASLTLFAYVMIRTALRQAGESDRGMADYVTSIVLNFGVRGRALRISDSDDEVYDAIVELCEDLNDPDARRSFLVRTHLGNYALWLSGIFPDFIEQRHSTTRRSRPRLLRGDGASRLPDGGRPSTGRGARTHDALRQRGRPLRASAHGAQHGERHAVLSGRELARAVDAPGER